MIAVARERQRQAFDLALERMRLRAMLVLAQAGTAPPEVPKRQLEADLTRVEGLLASLRRDADGAGPPLRDVRLARTLALSPDEIDLLWAAIAVAVDPRLQPHAVLLGGNEARRGLTLALFSALMGLDGARARALTLSLGPSHPLIRNHVLTFSDDNLAPASRPLGVPPRVASFLSGGDSPDEGLASSGGPVVPPAEPHFDAAQRSALKRIAQALGQGHSRRPEAQEDQDPAIRIDQTALLLALEGPPGAGRRTAVATLAESIGRRVVALDVRRLAPSVAALEAALVALARECLLTDSIPIVAEVDDLAVGEGADPSAGARLRALARAVDEMGGVVVLTTSLPGMDFGTRRRLLRVTWPVPDTATRRSLWTQALGAGAAETDLDGVAHRYRLGAGGILRAVSTARLIAQSREPHLGAAEPDAPSELTPNTRDLIEGVRNNIAERLGGLASRVEVRQSWDDLVLAPDTLDQVLALVARVRHAHQVYERWGFHRKMPRGIGVAGLFSGPPGTGKTMVAGLIARDLDLELYQVDLSKVVSKWVGETEKQLGKIFEAAEAGHALLLFDEADALFAKRTAEVKSATDRYANLEVNYLLQRIESFGGITILTTNLDTAIDPALRRRLAANIVFWAPDLQERITLWKRLLPREAPVAPDVNFESLAEKFPDMTGANIRNAVLSAAFLAASEESPITQRHFERAGKGEYRAMGRVLGQTA